MVIRDLKKLVVGGVGEDRISQFPDEIIHTILYKLNSQEEAARTSVLSRRWLQLWRCYPSFEFRGLSESNESKFRSFVASTSRRLLPRRPSDSDHRSSSSCCAVVEAIHDFRILLRQDDFQEKDLDDLLLLITNANAPFWLELDIHRIKAPPGYRFPVPNWSRTGFIFLSGCDLTPSTTTFGVHDNGFSLGSLEVLDLYDACLSEELLQNLLANAPRLVVLSLFRIFGIDRLEIVCSPCLRDLHLNEIYRVGWPESHKMRRLRISSPQLQTLKMGLSLEELEIDAPHLLSLCWNVSPGDPLTNVNVVNLASNCQSTIDGFPLDSFRSERLRRSLSTTFAKFHHVDLGLCSGFPSAEQQVPLDLSQAECAFPPPLIDQVRYQPAWEDIRDIEEAAVVLDCLFLSFRPKIMSITSKDQDQMAECMCLKYLKADPPGAATAATSWRHHLKDVKIENDTTGEMMEISEGMIPSLAKRETVRFMLTWC